MTATGRLAGAARRGRLAAAGALVAGAASAAPAAALGPGAPVAVGGLQDAASCLRATGGPGQLVLQAPAARRFATDVRAGTRVTGTVRLGTQTGCAEAAAGGGRLLVAAPTATRRGTAIRAAFGPGAPVRTLASVAATTSIESLRVAVGPNGHAAVVWVELERDGDGDGFEDSTVRSRVRLARAGADGTLAAPVTVGGRMRTATLDSSPQVEAGVDAGGRLVVVTSEARPPLGRGGRIADLHRLVVRSAADGVALGAPQVLDPRRQGPIDPQLSVAADGSALLAAASSFGVAAWSGSGAAGRFDRVLDVRAAEDGSPEAPGVRQVLAEAPPETPAVVAGPDRSGAVAWRTDGGATAVVALGPGAAVGRPTTILRGGAADGSGSGFVVFGEREEPFAIFDEPVDRPALALAADGALAVAMTGTAGPGMPVVAYGATGSLAGGVARARRLTSAARSASRVAAFLDVAGRPGVAVADESGDILSQTRDHDGRLTVATDRSVPAARRPAPEARIVLPLRATVIGGGPATVRVRCAAACDVRAELRGLGSPLGGAGTPVVAADALRRAGTAVLHLGTGSRLIRGRRARLPLRVRVAAPGSLRSTTLTGALALRQLPLRPAPRLTVVRVRRTRTTAIVTVRFRDGRRAFELVGLDGSRFGGPTARARRVGPGVFVLRIAVRASSRSVDVLGFSEDPADAVLRRRVVLPRR